MPLYDCTPDARISAITGDNARARVSAWVTIASLARTGVACELALHERQMSLNGSGLIAV